MSSLPGLLRADLLKTRRTPFILIHLLAPLIGTAVFLAYYSYSPWNAIDKALVFIQSLGCALPALIGLVCSMSAEQEAGAGQFQGMLAMPANKISAYISKLLLLLLFGLGAILLAYLIFALGFGGILQQDRLGIPFYLTGAVILFGSSIFLYVMHLFISLRLGKGASIGAGIAGSLIAALMLTGLGDIPWPYTPFAWGTRFISLWTIHASGTILPPALPELKAGITLCTAGTILAVILSCIWFRRWEGRSSDN
ncbi:lantibiotic immunity ABC transporter MutG family permease subunit [Paenibacillus sp. MMS20-IR301]|uniref:lantibiotic immunity ABC transporter MutG family permease subunit n=1 Tax=Paenibacillus sp. MMS20-IR301 TaxID=2895946 RepID=UPI0028E58CF9|nr:lantibiotic immunity ABC transporter MutG family permease subunit [Paenibacillus sp. MMS20-IR301]WNS42339.1 lantibiotic immunity ABC transporter MutG family permease subunit [Paenibacillus sp. MMS20-IR301]